MWFLNLTFLGEKPDQADSSVFQGPDNFMLTSEVNSKNFPMPDYCAMLPISNKENSRVMLVLNKNLHAMVKTESLTPRSVNLLFPPITNATKEMRSEDEQNIYGLCSFVSSTTG